jgi:hypothetical protein
MKLISYVYKIKIIGGEPFMNGELHKLLLFIRKYRRRYLRILIITNGTIVPQEGVLRVIKKTKARVRISDYGTLSVNRDKLAAALSEYKIPYEITNPVWTAVSQLVDGRGVSDEEAARKWRECAAGCNHIRGGRFYYCPFLASADRLGAIPHDARNYVDLLDGATTGETIKRYKSKENVPPGCGWCSGGSGELPEIPVAKQLKEPLGYAEYE